MFIMDPIPRDLDKKKAWLTKHWVYTELHSISFLSANTKILDFLDEKMLMKYIQRYQSKRRKKQGADRTKRRVVYSTGVRE